MAELAAGPTRADRSADESTTRSAQSPLARALLGLLRVYRATGSVRQPRCRFYPSCSQYAMEAIHLHGALRGLGYAAARLLRCHPFHPGGVDYVPTRDRP